MTDNILTLYRAHVLDAVSRLSPPATAPLHAITVETPRDPTHGDLATNAAMVLAKPMGQSPRAIAEGLIGPIRALPGVISADIAGPGFINMRLEPGFWQSHVRTILMRGAAYGQSTMGNNRQVNIEFVSANPTGPMHMGHCRGAVVGDALARLMAFAGFEVTREYFINDAGSQVVTLARSVHLRYREALGEDIGDIPEGFYPGDYLKPVGQNLADTYGARYRDADEQEWLPLFKRLATDAMMAMIKQDLAKLGIQHDRFFSEQSLDDDGKIDAAIADLEAKGLIYTGVLPPPKGDVLEDWEPKPLLLFRASQFGDDTDRPLKKSSGEWTYFGADIAYHRDKVLRADLLINVWGADHGGVVKRMQAALLALTGRDHVLDIQLVQMVRLFRQGEPVKMSKRAGNFVTLADVVEEVGRDVVRFMMLTRKSDSQLDFDFAKVVEQSRDNPVFYVQYAHARMCSVLKKAAEITPDVANLDRCTAADTLARLDRPEEHALIKHLALFPRIIEAAAETHEPHRIAFYLGELAASLHGLWNAGNDDPGLRFIMPEDQTLTVSRAALLQAARHVLRNGLAIMGVDPVEEM